ncbi:MAG: tRNA adenosine(34) deaminase TadA [Desulfococcaceae bacterium]
MTADSSHSFWMSLALREAERAARAGEVPVGAILVTGDNKILAADHNRTRARNDPTAHAEIQVLREGSRILQNYRLLNTRLYVTVEPCVMCMGAIIHARVAQVVYGAPDPRWGAVGSLYDFSQDDRFNHQPEIVSGVLEDACRDVMQAFFRVRRRAAPRRPPTADTDS